MKNIVRQKRVDVLCKTVVSTSDRQPVIYPFGGGGLEIIDYSRRKRNKETLPVRLKTQLMQLRKESLKQFTLAGIVEGKLTTVIGEGHV